jgi:hypothetical protein
MYISKQEIQPLSGIRKDSLTIIKLSVFILLTAIAAIGCHSNRVYVNNKLGIMLSHPTTWEITEAQDGVVSILVPGQRRINTATVAIWKGFSVPFANSPEETIQKELEAYYARIEENEKAGSPHRPHQVIYGKPVSGVSNNLDFTLCCVEANYAPGIINTCFVFVQKNSAHVLIGVSGAGKSATTAVETIIAGFQFLDQGE